MKLCFPVQSDNGLDGKIFNHFGTAPFFIVVDLETEAVSTIDNQDLGHVHGQCNPMKALNGKMVDAVIVGGIGGGAITGLNNMGIKVYKTAQGSIRDHIDLFKAGSLMEMNLSHTCAGHGDECNHGPALKPIH